MNTMFTAASDVDYDEATGNGDRWIEVPVAGEPTPEEMEDFARDMESLITAGPGPSDAELEAWFAGDARSA